MYIVTGGSCFIGSNIVRGLNQTGIHKILVVDDLEAGDKFANLVGCQIQDYLDKEHFHKRLEDGSFPFHEVEAVFHQGACTDTMEYDGKYMMENNYAYSQLLLHQALSHRIPYIYASSAAVYGSNASFKECPENEKPGNIYGFSKHLFDQYVRRHLGNAESTLVGLRYFNVYGPHEGHKGRMASVMHQFYHQLYETSQIRLYQGTGGYDDGEQRRDFIFVSDVVKVNLFFLDNEPTRGIFNVGTGESRSFNDVARCLIEQHGAGEIKFIPFPESLQGKYQSYTQADISALRAVGFDLPFVSLEDGIGRYYAFLNQDS